MYVGHLENLLEPSRTMKSKSTDIHIFFYLQYAINRTKTRTALVSESRESYSRREPMGTEQSGVGEILSDHSSDTSFVPHLYWGFVNLLQRAHGACSAAGLKLGFPRGIANTESTGL